MSDDPSDYWPGYPYSKKKKKKDMSRLNTSFRLPRTDEMVLLKPISTRADGPSNGEGSRVDSINDQLVTYNRWLAFVPETRPGARVRGAAAQVQRSLYEYNTLVASMMLQIDQKIADLQDHTADFVEAVKDGGTWQANGSLTELTYDELDKILEIHPQRNTEAYRKHLADTVKKATRSHEPLLPPPPPTSFVPYSNDRYADKLLRIIQEVEACPGGTVSALHLLVYVKSVVLLGTYAGDNSFPSDRDYTNVDTAVLALVDRTRTAFRTGATIECLYFDFAAARRLIHKHLPRRCRICPSTERSQQGLDPFGNLDTFSSFPPPTCSRQPHLRLLEHVQKWAYAEIRSGVMLTLGKKLPREMCLTIFEFAMMAEGTPLDPRVREEDTYLTGMCVRGDLKKEYSCQLPARASTNTFDDLNWAWP